MKQTSRARSNVQRVVSAVAVIVGLATVVAGSRVLSGVDPGYVVFRPLLVFNVLMGMGYIAAGVAIWHGLRQGRFAAATILGLNVMVLLAITILFANGADVAPDSVRAMIFRTAVWLVLLIVLRRSEPSGTTSTPVPFSGATS